MSLTINFLRPGLHDHQKQLVYLSRPLAQHMNFIHIGTWPYACYKFHISTLLQNGPPVE